MTFENEVIERLVRLEEKVSNHLAHKERSNQVLQWLIGSSVAVMAIAFFVK